MLEGVRFVACRVAKRMAGNGVVTTKINTSNCVLHILMH